LPNFLNKILQIEYLAQWDVEQLSNPDEFFFPEMLIGEGCESLARFGPTCYLVCITDLYSLPCLSCVIQSAVSQHAEQASHQMKLYLWEPADVDSEFITGGFSYRSDIYPEANIINILQRFLIICEEVHNSSVWHIHACFSFVLSGCDGPNYYPSAALAYSCSQRSQVNAASIICPIG
jgi:hypothetical protein